VAGLKAIMDILHVDEPSADPNLLPVDYIFGSDSQSGTLDGSWRRDDIFGGTQNDTVDGHEGNDSISGGAGNDSLTGGQGDDTISGGGRLDVAPLAHDGTDTLLGGDGNDLIMAGNGSYDSITAGDGDDKIVVLGDNSTVTGGAGDDVIDETGIGNYYASQSGTVFFGNGSGHDYIVFHTDISADDPAYTIYHSNVLTIEMPGVNASDVTLHYDRTLLSHEVGTGDFAGWTWDNYAGDAVVMTSDGSTIYIGQLFETVTTNSNNNVSYDIRDSTSLLFDFNGNYQYIENYFTDESQLVIGSIAAYIHAPDSWA
jgi:Ca2+-binding RTX toxin-like protein